MIGPSLPYQALLILVEDGTQRDLAAARRKTLLEILWHERFLSREQLIARVEGIKGKDCFGISAWQDTFYRDMRVVKKALNNAGYTLRYCRNKKQRGYYLQNQPAVSEELSRALESSFREVDPAQIMILRQMPPAERFQRGCSISDTARMAVAYRIRQRNPRLSEAEANYLALQPLGDR
jgi:hypothetical protein